MNQTFYRAFEDRHRGSRELIKGRLAAYRPFLLPLAAREGAPARALDLGCGRGEWLELLAECGLDALGIDLDEGMLAACRERGLRVELVDALASLRGQADASLALVSAFHLVEHLPFPLVRELITEAHRALRPGGLLILETPNPENLSVGASSFYLDPTHERPLPPALLAFAVEFGGYARHRVLRLQEDPALHGPAQVGLITVLEGVSPDYAVVAQKAGAPAALTPLDGPFTAEYGITLGALAQRYEQQRQHDSASLHRGLAQANGELDAQRAGHAALADDLTRFADRTSADQARMDALQARFAAQMGTLQGQQADQAARLERLEARGVQLEQRIVDLLASSSWRVTAPLRWAGTQVHRVRAAVRERRVLPALRHRVKGPLVAAMRAVLRRPRLKRAARALLARWPTLQARLYRLAYQAPTLTAAAPPPSEQQLSPRALHAYQQLQRALAAHLS